MRCSNWYITFHRAPKKSISHLAFTTRCQSIPRLYLSTCPHASTRLCSYATSKSDFVRHLDRSHVLLPAHALTSGTQIWNFDAVVGTTRKMVKAAKVSRRPHSDFSGFRTVRCGVARWTSRQACKGTAKADAQILDMPVIVTEQNPRGESPIQSPPLQY